MTSQPKVVIGLSGGVDSAVAALLLKQQNYDLHAIFMQNWQADQNDPYCTIEQDLQDAKAVAKLLNIPFTTINFSQEYWQNVFQHFLDEYAAGRTPNPDILCNQEIKFKAFLNYALEKQNANFIATGHYARICKKDNAYNLLRGIDQAKDQSYFLHRLTQKQLAHTLFPIGELSKTEVRQLASQHNLPNHAKKDSTGICFIGERKFKEFLSEYLLNQPGQIVTDDGTVIAQHDGLMFYTLGQRKGLGIGGRQQSEEKPWYVIAKDTTNNQLIVAQNREHQRLYRAKLQATQTHFISGQTPSTPLPCTAKIRYQQKDQKCTIIKMIDGICDVEFEQLQWAVTPGQSIVFYQNEVCLGGGVIR